MLEERWALLIRPEYVQATRRGHFVESLIFGGVMGATGGIFPVVHSEHVGRPVDVSIPTIVFIVALLGLFVACVYYFGRRLYTKHASIMAVVSDEKGRFMSLGVTLKFSREDPPVIRKNASGKRWLLTTASKRGRTRMKALVVAYPELDDFVRMCCPYCEVAVSADEKSSGERTIHDQSVPDEGFQ